MNIMIITEMKNACAEVARRDQVGHHASDSVSIPPQMVTQAPTALHTLRYFVINSLSAISRYAFSVTCTLECPSILLSV